MKYRIYNKKLGMYTNNLKYPSDSIVVVDGDGDVMEIVPNSYDFFDVNSVNKNDFSIERCTDVKDMDGNLIYEGDLLEVQDNMYDDPVEIWYNPSESRFQYERLEIFPNEDYEYKIVGNIHERDV